MIPMIHSGQSESFHLIALSKTSCYLLCVESFVCFYLLSSVLILSLFLYLHQVTHSNFLFYFSSSYSKLIIVCLFRATLVFWSIAPLIAKFLLHTFSAKCLWDLRLFLVSFLYALLYPRISKLIRFLLLKTLLDLYLQSYKFLRYHPNYLATVLSILSLYKAHVKIYHLQVQ